MSDLCVHQFDRLVVFGEDDDVRLLHKLWAVRVQGWCPACGTIIAKDGRKFTPSETEWDILDGNQVAEVA